MQYLAAIALLAMAATASAQDTADTAGPPPPALLGTRVPLCLTLEGDESLPEDQEREEKPTIGPPPGTPLPAPPTEPNFWLTVGPTVGFVRARRENAVGWTVGVQGRVRNPGYIGAEVSVAFQQLLFEGGDITASQIPIQLTLLAYPIPEWTFRPYGLAGIGWAFTSVEYSGARFTFNNQTLTLFETHIGGGLEAEVARSMSAVLDVRYLFMADKSPISSVKSKAFDPSDFNSWQITAALNFAF